VAVTRRELITGAAAGAAGLVVGGVVGKVAGDDGEGGGGGSSGLAGDAGKIADARGLSADDVARAVKTFVPPGEHDEYVILSSGGHSGQILVIGVPSMRILKVVGVFSPEPWQGYGYGADWGEHNLDMGTGNGKPMSPSRGPKLLWGDTHHPAISETNAEYDGRFCYINDRANGRIAMIDLRDFKTKQIIDVPNLDSSHGGCFVTQNSEYVHISTKIPTLVDTTNIDGALDNFAKSFRGYSTFLKIDQKTGQMMLDQSFQVELPPYTQDLADSGKLVSHGWVFINSYNAEMASGGNMEGKVSLEAGASAGDYDYMHMVNWQKGEEVIKAGKFKTVNGMKVITMETAVAEGMLFLVPEPRSPHGVDVSPSGTYMTVGGKLDPNVTIFSIDKLKAAIEKKDYEKIDQFGVPILKFDSCVEARIEVGAGPLHTQYDEKGHGYTSLFVASAVAKFTLGKPDYDGPNPFKLVDTLPVHYNIGHLCTMEGDTAKPDGKYLVALNKWSIDRHLTVGTLKPQNFQLVDLTGEKMDIITDMPIGVGEPHYVQAIKADKLKAWEVYPPGTNPVTMEVDPNAVKDGQEGVTRNGNNVTVKMTITRSRFKPDIVRLKKGDKVTMHLTNIETTPDATHGFAIPRYNVNISLDAGEYTRLEFEADATGAFAMYCTEFCSALHLEMQGWLLIS
jgi:nitrous-oxide reductase